MKKHFFDKFPIIKYANNSVRNIFAKVVLDDSTKQKPENFVQIIMEDDNSLRADVAAERYYGSPYFDWVYYMSNDVVDPYNDVFLDNELFINMIISKYGSIELAQQKIEYYINNWFENSEDKLTISQYESASKNVKKYYTAKIDYSNRITEYVRHRKDWKKSTNKLRILTLDSVESLGIETLVYQYVSGNLVASGEIVDINTEDKKITVKNITGAFVSTSNVLYRFGSTTQYVVSAVASPHTEDNIPADEASFWSPMTYFNAEQEQNQLRKTVKFLRKGGISALDRNIEKLLE